MMLKYVMYDGHTSHIISERAWMVRVSSAMPGEQEWHHLILARGVYDLPTPQSRAAAINVHERESATYQVVVQLTPYPVLDDS